MKLLLDKKGMTLVEIIVVLLIMSILMVIMGSLILNAFNYFNKTTDQDINKRSLDSVSEYIRNELLYASDVRVQEEKPNEEEWNTLYIVEGKLYKNEEAVYSEGFYNQNQLEIKVRGFEQYRLDIDYSYRDFDNTNAYKTNDTLELLNLKINVENNNFDPFSNISTLTSISDKVKIYYQNTIKIIEEEPPKDPDAGTVADLMDCLNFHNNRMNFKKGKPYRLGDMVYYDKDDYDEDDDLEHDFSGESSGSWWQLCGKEGQTDDITPGTSSHVWKKISPYFDKYSCYTKGDVIIYNDKYYRCIKDIINRSYSPTPESWDDWKTYWEECKQPTESRLTCGSYTKAYKGTDHQSVVYKIIDYLEQNQLSLEDIPTYVPHQNYHEGEFVRVYDSERRIYRYFLKLKSGNVNTWPGSEPEKNDHLVWQEMRLDFDSYSGYSENDVVYYSKRYEYNGYILANFALGKYPIKMEFTDNWTKLNIK